jgi:hypothetical protein
MSNSTFASYNNASMIKAPTAREPGTIQTLNNSRLVCRANHTISSIQQRTSDAHYAEALRTSRIDLSVKIFSNT